MEEEKHLNEEPFNLTRLEYAQYCYDATWTLAYALNQTIKGLICSIFSSLITTVQQKIFEWSNFH